MNGKLLYPTFLEFKLRVGKYLADPTELDVEVLYTNWIGRWGVSNLSTNNKDYLDQQMGTIWSDGLLRYLIKEEYKDLDLNSLIELKRAKEFTNYQLYNTKKNTSGLTAEQASDIEEDTEYASDKSTTSGSVYKSILESQDGISNLKRGMGEFIESFSSMFSDVVSDATNGEFITTGLNSSHVKDDYTEAPNSGINTWKSAIIMNYDDIVETNERIDNLPTGEKAKYANGELVSGYTPTKLDASDSKDFPTIALMDDGLQSLQNEIDSNARDIETTDDQVATNKTDISLKQNKTDDRLQTTAKTITDAINENKKAIDAGANSEELENDVAENGQRISNIEQNIFKAQTVQRVYQTDDLDVSDSKLPDAGIIAEFYVDSALVNSKSFPMEIDYKNAIYPSSGLTQKAVRMQLYNKTTEKNLCAWKTIILENGLGTAKENLLIEGKMNDGDLIRLLEITKKNDPRTSDITFYATSKYALASGIENNTGKLDESNTWELEQDFNNQRLKNVKDALTSTDATNVRTAQQMIDASIADATPHDDVVIEATYDSTFIDQTRLIVLENESSFITGNSFATHDLRFDTNLNMVSSGGTRFQYSKSFKAIPDSASKSTINITQQTNNLMDLLETRLLVKHKSDGPQPEHWTSLELWSNANVSTLQCKMQFDQRDGILTPTELLTYTNDNYEYVFASKYVGSDDDYRDRTALSVVNQKSSITGKVGSDRVADNSAVPGKENEGLNGTLNSLKTKTADNELAITKRAQLDRYNKFTNSNDFGDRDANKYTNFSQEGGMEMTNTEAIKYLTGQNANNDNEVPRLGQVISKGNNVVDDPFSIRNADNTKIEIDGEYVNLYSNGYKIGSFSSKPDHEFDVHNYHIKNVANPVDGKDATNMDWVKNQIAGGVTPALIKKTWCSVEGPLTNSVGTSYETVFGGLNPTIQNLNMDSKPSSGNGVYLVDAKQNEVWEINLEVPINHGGSFTTKYWYAYLPDTNDRFTIQGWDVIKKVVATDATTSILQFKWTIKLDSGAHCYIYPKIKASSSGGKISGSIYMTCKKIGDD